MCYTGNAELVCKYKSHLSKIFCCGLGFSGLGFRDLELRGFGALADGRGVEFNGAKYGPDLVPLAFIKYITRNPKPQTPNLKP